MKPSTAPVSASILPTLFSCHFVLVAYPVEIQSRSPMYQDARQPQSCLKQWHHRSQSCHYHSTLPVCGASSPVNISILRDLKLSRFLSSCILYCHYRTFNSPLNFKCLKSVLLWQFWAPDTSSVLPSYFYMHSRPLYSFSLVTATKAQQSWSLPFLLHVNKWNIHFPICSGYNHAFIYRLWCSTIVYSILKGLSCRHGNNSSIKLLSEHPAQLYRLSTLSSSLTTNIQIVTQYI